MENLGIFSARAIQYIFSLTRSICIMRLNFLPLVPFCLDMMTEVIRYGFDNILQLHDRTLKVLFINLVTYFSSKEF